MRGEVANSGSGVIGVGRVGVKGIGARGAYFSGTVAQIRMKPAKRITHPSRGDRGDLFVDKGGRLWFCRGGKNWKRLA